MSRYQKIGTKNNFPKISVIIGSHTKTLDNLEKCIRNIRKQKYLQRNLEIVIGFGGKLGDIKSLVNKYNLVVIVIPEDKQNAEYNRGIAFIKAKHDLTLIFDDDNFFPNKNTLKELADAFQRHPEILAVESCYYFYSPRMNMLDRYFALFGVLDPLAYYLGKADRMRQDSKQWNQMGTATDMGSYFLVDFPKDPSRVSTIGANGCIVNKKFLLESSDTRPEYFYHTDILIDAIFKGHNKMAFTKNSIAHYTGNHGLFHFLRKRFEYMLRFSLEENYKRRFRVFMRGDELKLIKSILICITIVIPVWDSLRGYVKIKDPAWFIHPFMCLGMTLTYGVAVAVNYIKKIK